MITAVMGYSPLQFITIFAAAIPILIPIFQFGVIFRLWDKYNQPVNKDLCICSCWDTVFKGQLSKRQDLSNKNINHFFYLI